MDYIKTSPYLSELRELADSALYQLDQLADAAKVWVQLRDQLEAQAKAERRGYDRNSFYENLNAAATTQTHILDALEAFLAVWARISLIIFPTAKNDDMRSFRIARGEHLRRLLNLSYPEILESRELRNSWMHFDERLDRAVRNSTWGSRQRFVRSRDAPGSIPGTLRLVEVDTLIVHFRDEGDSPCSANLYELRSALQDLEAKLSGAWATLQEQESPEDDSAD